MNIHYEDVSRETISFVDELCKRNRSQLNQYRDLLLWWNSHINLISRKIPSEIVSEHIKHSLFLSTLPEFKKESIFIDAGTGGGLPGIPLAIAYPEKFFYLNDLVSKKILAVSQITKNLKLSNCESIRGSIGDTNFPVQNISIISKHAFKINELYHHLRNISWNNLFLIKGCPFQDELVSLPEHLYIRAYRLDAFQNNEFYINKCIIVIQNNIP